MPSLVILREVFNSLGCKSPPEWVEKLEAANDPIVIPTPQRFFKEKEQEKNHIPFGKWWLEWFGLKLPPEWMKPFADWFLDQTFQKSIKGEGIEDTPSSIKIPSSKNAKTVAWRNNENWPSRKKVIFVPHSKKHYQSKSSWFNDNWGKPICRKTGKTIIAQLVAKRIWDPNLRKKVIAEPKTRKVLTLAGETEFFISQYQQKIFSADCCGKVRLYDFLEGEKVFLGEEYCSSNHDFVMALIEQKEKLFGVECTSGCRKPRWMKEGRWKEISKIDLFSYLNTDWSSRTGVENPDLIAKFSGLDLLAPIDKQTEKEEPENKKTPAVVHSESTEKSHARVRRQKNQKNKGGKSREYRTRDEKRWKN